MEVDFLRGNILMKQVIKIAIVMVMHYFHAVFEHGLPPNLNLNQNAYSIFPRIHVRRESMARGTRDKEMGVPAHDRTLLPHNANYPKYQPPPNIEFP